MISAEREEAIRGMMNEHDILDTHPLMESTSQILLAAARRAGIELDHGETAIKMSFHSVLRGIRDTNKRLSFLRECTVLWENQEAVTETAQET